MNQNEPFNSSSDSQALAAIATGQADAAHLAATELANRGRNSAGAWVGFDEAAGAVEAGPYSLTLTRDQVVHLYELARRDFMRQEKNREKLQANWEAKKGAGALAPESVRKHAAQDAAMVNLLADKVDQATQHRHLIDRVATSLAEPIV